MGPSTSSSIAWASPPPMFFPWAVKAATRSDDAKSLLKLLDGGVGERFEDVGFLRHVESGGCLVTTRLNMPKKANIFESFSHSAIQQFKEAFGIMDTDKDGLLSSSDLVAAFTAHGKNIGGGEAQAM